MEKIVVVTDHPEEASSLIMCISELFPECEIQIFSSQMGSLVGTQVVPEQNT